MVINSLLAAFPDSDLKKKLNPRFKEKIKCYKIISLKKKC